MKSVLNMESMRSRKGDVEAISLTHTPIGRDGKEVRKGRKKDKQCGMEEAQGRQEVWKRGRTEGGVRKEER
jgi:hypothetical protein